MVLQILTSVWEEADVILEFLEFAWEVINLCTFVTEEALQSLFMGIASSLNKGDIAMAKFGRDELLEDTVNVFTMHALLCAGIGLPSLLGYIFFAVGCTSMISEIDEAIDYSTKFMNIRTRKPYTRYGRFF